MNDNPFGPAYPGQPDYPGYSGYPPPRRRGWPSWVIVLVAVGSGLALAGASTAAVVGVATSAADSSSSSSSSGPAASPGDGSSPSPGSGDGSDDRTVQIDFPNGSTGTFTVPTGLHHEADDDDAGHVALAGDQDSAAFLDLYTDETTASQAQDLHRVAQQNAADDHNHGDTIGTISYHTVGGHAAAQYQLSHLDGSGTFDALVTVVLVGDDQISLYWSDDADDFDPSDGQQIASAVLHSMRVSGGDGSDGSGGSDGSDGSGSGSGSSA